MTILPKTKKLYSKDREKSIASCSSTSSTDRTRQLSVSTRKPKKHGSDSSSFQAPPNKRAAHISSQSPKSNEAELINWDQLDQEFVEKLKNHNGWEVKEMVGDGACMFRAVSEHVYGDQEMHSEVRRLCMDYMERNRDHFSQFITEDFTDYITRKRQITEHGDHSELQAMSEIYARPVEVYEYDVMPINIFHPTAAAEMNAPLRLSYHQGNHYNAIVDPNTATIGVGLGLPGHVPGAADAQLLAEAVNQSESFHLEETMLHDKIHMTDWQRTEDDIKDQVARESYMDYVRSLDKNKKSPGKSSPPRKATSSTTPVLNEDQPCSSRQAGLYEELLAMGAVEWPDDNDEDAMMTQALLLSQQQFMEDFEKREQGSSSSAPGPSNQTP